VRLTDPLPLRTSADLGQYTTLFTLPRPMGLLTCNPVRYDGSGHFWLLADAPIGGVDAVSYQGRTISAWALQNGTDTSGHAVAVLETEEQIEDPADLAVTLRGERHPDTGQSLDRPDLQIEHLMRLAGITLSAGRLDDLRAWCQSNSLTTAGLLDDHTLSVQGWLDRLCQGAGLAWGQNLPGLAQPWPPISSASVGTLTARESPTLSATCDADQLATVLELRYDYDWAAADYRGTLRLSAPSAVHRFGERLARVDLGWVHDARAAIAHGERWLAYRSRPLWRLEARATQNLAQIGDSITVDHAHSAINAGVVTRRTWRPTETLLQIEAPAGSASAVQVDAIAAGIGVDQITAPEYDYQAGQATVLITDSTGAPIPGARVTLDGGITRSADNQGWVQFSVAPGNHSLYVQAIGYDPFTLPLVVS